MTTRSIIVVAAILALTIEAQPPPPCPPRCVLEEHLGVFTLCWRPGPLGEMVRHVCIDRRIITRERP